MVPKDGLFGEFRPDAERDRWFERHRGVALLLALLAHVVLAGVVVYLEMTREPLSEEVILGEPEIENLQDDFVEEEEPEPEIDIEMEPEPEPRRKQEIRNVKEQTKDVRESEVAQKREEVEYDNQKPPPPDNKPEKKPQKVAETKAPKAKRKKKTSEGVGDRTAARPMPAEGTPPKPLKSNRAPAYPEALRKKNVTGTVKVKLKIYMDGSVRGIKVLRKDIKGTEDPEEAKRAQSLLLKAVVSAVKAWKFTPAKLKGQTITVWWPVTFPFNLS